MIRRFLARRRAARWFAQQTAWMKEALAFIKIHSPERHRSICERMMIHLAAPDSETPFRVTQLIVSELEELRSEA